MKRARKSPLTGTELLDKLFPKINNDLTPRISENYKTTFHKDGTVSFWCVYNQIWKRLKMEQIPPQNIASFSFEERSKIIGKLLKKN
jgi:hypothetical protein